LQVLILKVVAGGTFLWRAGFGIYPQKQKAAGGLPQSKRLLSVPEMLLDV
jgi:hypothetical protein